MNNLEQAAQQVLDALGTTWVVVPPDSDERLDAAISALEKALAEKPEQPDLQLCNFYKVDSFPALVAAQENHIERLQAKLSKYQSPMYMGTPREG